LDELGESIEFYSVLTFLAIFFLWRGLVWVRRVKRTVRGLRAREYNSKELPEEFSRKIPLVSLGLGLFLLALWIAFEFEPGGEEAMMLLAIPYAVVMGIAGLVEPSLWWAIYPDAAGKLPTAKRIIGASLSAVSMLGGVAWFVWFSLM